jgi:AraC family transcriptional activator FtrA
MPSRCRTRAAVDRACEDTVGYFPVMHRVVALARPVQSTFELGCAVEVFGTQRPG